MYVLFRFPVRHGPTQHLTHNHQTTVCHLPSAFRLNRLCELHQRLSRHLVHHVPTKCRKNDTVQPGLSHRDVPLTPAMTKPLKPHTGDGCEGVHLRSEEHTSEL